MTSATAKDMLFLWVMGIRAISGSETYSYNAGSQSFQDAAFLVNRLNQEKGMGIHPGRWVRIQIKAIQKQGRTNSLWPNILVGEQAVQRFKAATQNFTYVDEVESIKQSLKMDEKNYNRVKAVVGDDGDPFDIASVNYSPLFRFFKYSERGEEVDPDLEEKVFYYFYLHPGTKDAVSQEQLSLLSPVLQRLGEKLYEELI